MLALVGCVIFGGIYFLLARTYKKTDLARRERSPVDGTRQIVGTIAIVAAVFVLIEFVMYWASDLDWANQGLLTIERTLSQVRFALSLTFTSPSFWLVTVAVFFVSMCLPSICVLSGIARRLPTVATKWLGRANAVLAIVTSLTFFGTGTRDGLAKIEAGLVENHKKVERGLENVEDLGRQIAEQAVEDAISEIIKEHIQQEIDKLINYDDIIAEYPYITWSHVWELTFDEPLNNDSKLFVRQVAKAKSARAPDTSFIQFFISEFEATPPTNRTVPVEKLTIRRSAATLNWVQHMQAELERFVAPEPSPMSPTKNDNVLRTGFLLLVNFFDALLSLFTGGESVLYNILGLFWNEILKWFATLFFDHVFVDGRTPTEAYSRVIREVKRIVRPLYEQKLKPRINSIIPRLHKEERRWLENLVREKSNALSALNDANKAIENCKEYLTVPSRNTSTESEVKDLLEKSIKKLFPNTSSELKLKDFKELSPKISLELELEALLEKLSKDFSLNTPHEFGPFRDEKLLNSSSGADAIEQLRIFEDQVRLPPKAPILTRMEMLKMIVRRIRIR